MKKKTAAILCIIVCAVIILPFPAQAQAAGSEREVIVGGTLFGARMYTDGALVVGLDKVTPQGNASPKAPAYDGGLRLKDVIIEINGKHSKATRSCTW